MLKGGFMTAQHELNIPIAGNFEMKYYCNDTGEISNAHSFPPHIHDTVEIYILLEGDVSFMVEHSLYKLRPGDIIITKPNETHNCILNSDSPHRHICFWIDPSCDFLLSGFLHHDFGEDNLCSPKDEDGKIILSLCRELAEPEAENDRKKCFFLAAELLYYIDRNLGKPSKTEALPEILENILDDIHENLSKINTLSYFEEKYFISPSTLNRLFHKYLRTSPKYYLETKRLAYSRLLLGKGHSVSEACGIAGFPDYSNFIRLFRNRFGITPLQYRNQKQGRASL